MIRYILKVTLAFALFWSHRVACSEETSCNMGQLYAEINGVKHVFNEGSVLVLVRGDILVLERATVQCGGKAVATDTIDLIGYAPRKKSLTDAHYVIDTSLDLQSKFARMSDGKMAFDVVVKSAEIGSSVWSIHVEEPRLDRVEFLVNGKVRVVGPGDEIKLKRDDQMKVSRVQSNVLGNDQVRHILKAAAADGKKGSEADSGLLRKGDLVFMRGSLVMGTIKVVVE
jgi:hypothetical protein